MAAIIGLVSTVAALLLTMVDHNVVRFMTESGYPAVRIIGIHARSLLIFLILTVVASLVLSNTLVAIVLFGVVMTALIFLTSRILAYRIHRSTSPIRLSVSGRALLSHSGYDADTVARRRLAILWHLHHRAGPVHVATDVRMAIQLTAHRSIDPATRVIHRRRPHRAADAGSD